MSDLKPFLDKKGTHCLNESDDHSLQGLLAGTGYLESDADCQLMITLGFNEVVKPTRVLLKGTVSKVAPAKLLVFQNNGSMDFDDAQSLKPDVERTFTQQDYEAANGEVVVELPLVKFSKVSFLTIFVVSNCSGDEDEVTRIDGLSVFSEATVKKTIQLVDTPAQFQSLVIHSSSPVVLDCFAGWCGPCTRIAPLFEELAQQHMGKVAAFKLDIDKNSATSKEIGVSSVPHFMLYHKGRMVSEVKGADTEKLRALFQTAADLQ